MVTLRKTYGAFGTHDATRGVAGTAYTGEVREAGTGWYLLGQRAYSPTLRRFLGPDRLSPFGAGGVNRYAYCSGDPIDRVDPGGNMWAMWQAISHGLSGRGGAVQAASETPQVIVESAVTPGTVSAFAAANATSSVAASISPGAVATAAQATPNGLLLPVLKGRDAATDATAFPRPKRATSARPAVEREELFTYPQQPRRADPKIYLNLGANVPLERRAISSSGVRYVRPKWYGFRPTNNRQSLVLAADTQVYVSQLGSLLDTARRLGVKRMTVLTGVHGNYRGQNYDVESLQRGPADPWVEPRVAKFMAQNSASYGVEVTLKNIGGWSIDDVRDEISQGGTYAFTQCWGLTDKAFWPVFNLPYIVLYHV
jgi:RHS repeat-associated protein